MFRNNLPPHDLGWPVKIVSTGGESAWREMSENGKSIPRSEE